MMAPASAAVQVTLVLCWLGLVGAVAEGLRRYRKANTEVTRKVVHIGAGHAIVLAWWLHTPAWMGIVAAVLFSGVALLSYRYPILPGINSIGRHSLGTFFYAVSIGLLTGLFWPSGHPDLAVLGVLVMTWGDGLAALVGQRFGRHPYRLAGMNKSWEGSATMALASGIVALTVLGGVYGWGGAVVGVAVAVALAATALEAVSTYGIDNLTVPVGSAVLAYGLLHWVGMI